MTRGALGQGYVLRQYLGTGGAWSGTRVSNPRPSPWQGDALPTELVPPRVRHLPAALRGDSHAVQSRYNENNPTARLKSRSIFHTLAPRASSSGKTCAGRSAHGDRGYFGLRHTPDLHTTPARRLPASPCDSPACARLKSSAPIRMRKAQRGVRRHDSASRRPAPIGRPSGCRHGRYARAPLAFGAMGGRRCPREERKVGMNGQPLAATSFENHRGPAWTAKGGAIGVESGRTPGDDAPGQIA
jgi:hypothetical protein